MSNINILCNSCGSNNPLNSQYCSECGTTILNDSYEDQSIQTLKPYPEIKTDTYSNWDIGDDSMVAANEITTIVVILAAFTIIGTLFVYVAIPFLINLFGIFTYFGMAVAFFLAIYKSAVDRIDRDDKEIKREEKYEENSINANKKIKRKKINKQMKEVILFTTRIYLVSLIIRIILTIYFNFIFLHLGTTLNIILTIVGEVMLIMVLSFIAYLWYGSKIRAEIISNTKET